MFKDLEPQYTLLSPLTACGGGTPTPSCSGITPCHWPQRTGDAKKVPRPPHYRDWHSHPSVPGKGAEATPCITQGCGQQQDLLPYPDPERGESSHHSPWLGAGGLSPPTPGQQVPSRRPTQPV